MRVVETTLIIRSRSVSGDAYRDSENLRKLVEHFLDETGLLNGVPPLEFFDDPPKHVGVDYYWSEKV